MSTIVTRFAPSPTGLLHAGNYRTAIYCYLFAKRNGGAFILRIEDTDKERSKKAYEDNILEALAWLGLPHDAFYRQSDRSPIHREHLERLIEKGQAYISKEEPRKEGGRESVIRFKNPNKTVAFKDAIRGEIRFDTTELGDFVIAKSLDEPLYHFAVVVDDVTTGVTHIIRGEDHISNTPRQMLIVEAIGGSGFTYAHLPLVLAPDRSKLSKRKGALPITDYRDQGILPEAMINFLALLGWNPGGEQEIFSREELIERFDLDRVHHAGAIFNEEKLLWFNHEHLQRLSDTDFFEQLSAYIPSNIKSLPQYSDERLTRLLPNLKERVSRFKDISDLAQGGELTYYFDRPEIEPSALSFKGETSLREIGEHLRTVVEALENISEEQFGAETVKASIWDYATEMGRGAVLWPMRFALSGKERSPDPFTLAQVLGKNETLSRLKAALILIEEHL